MSRISINTTQHVALSYEAASVGARIGAFALDALFYIAWAVLYYIITDKMGITMGDVGTFIFYLPIMFYSLICEVVFDGQSFGKMIAKIKVISTEGVPATFNNYFMRWVFRLIDILMTSGGLATLVILASNKGQRFGDMAANTTVITLRKREKLNEIIAPKVPEDYTVTFNEAAQLSDADIITMKKVFNYALRRANFSLIDETSDRVKTVLKIDSTMPSEEFLRTIVKDYQYLMSDYE